MAERPLTVIDLSLSTTKGCYKPTWTEMQLKKLQVIDSR